MSRAEYSRLREALDGTLTDEEWAKRCEEAGADTEVGLTGDQLVAIEGADWFADTYIQRGLGEGEDQGDLLP